MGAKEKLAYGDGGAFISHSKESLSLVYLQALLAKLGLNHSSPVIDNDSIDITIRGVDFSGQWKMPKVELQLKCTNVKSAIDVKKQELVFKLKKKNYNDLAGYSPFPQILVVHHAPDNQEGWVVESDVGATVKNMSYWFSLYGAKAISQATKTVRIPLQQRFDSKSLLWMMKEASNMSPVKNTSKGER